MSRKLLFKAFALAVALASALGANAYDFVEPGFYLNITGTNTVEITYNSSNPNYNSYTGYVSIPASITHNGTTYTVTGIGNHAFRNCDGLTGVSIPNTVKTIGNFAFYDCPGLTTIAIPYGVTHLGFDALGKTGLTSVYIPSSVTSMGSEMFYYCTSLRSVTLPESITYIDMRSFQGCTSLTRIVIPNGVTTIYSDAFKGCTSLQEVTIPRTTTTIKSGVFSGCTALNTVSCFATTPPSLYDDYVFPSEAYSNATLNVPSSAQSAYQAADGWKRFSTINGVDYDFVQDNLKYVITSSTTVKCVGTAVSYPVGRWIIPDIAQGYDVTAIGNEAFSDCAGITYIEIGPKVQSIGSMAFSGCTGLTSVTIPNSVTYVGGMAFLNCSSLESIIIGENCRFNNSYSWALNIFKGCSSLTSITCLSEEPWEFHEPMFDDATYANAVVWVPGGSEAGYRATNYWNKFSQIKGTYTLDQALNVEGGNLHFTTEDPYPWIVMVDDNGEPYAQSGNAGVAYSTSVLSTTVTVTEGTEVQFNLQARGEGTSTIYDKCRFEVDGNEVFTFGAFNANVDDWSTNRTSLSAGTHTLAWYYIKDGSVDPAGDYFAIRNVKLIAPETKRGDVDNSGAVDISDATALINYLLSGNSSGINLVNADCDLSGGVDISDATTLINYLLNGSW